MSTARAAPQIVQRSYLEADANALPADIHPVLRRVYAGRRMPAAELDTSLQRLLPVRQFSAAMAAARALADAFRRRERIVVLGDFDADGATATALCVSTLRAFGFDHVAYLVPDRFRFGYGLSSAIAEQAARHSPDIIVTVDNGVSSVAGVERANALGMRVIVTDHHLPGAELPPADFIVNPNLSNDDFPSKCLSGVGVAFYVMAALAHELGSRGEIDVKAARSHVAASFDLVALGTVADLVPLDHNNRVLVAEGLRRIRGGATRPGIDALFNVAGRDRTRASTGDLGFAIAPRLNAAGRLESMQLGIECLLASDEKAAFDSARRLDKLNAERRELQARMEQQAREHVERMADTLDGTADVYCLYDDSWHEGVVGLVASRTKDRVKRPVFAFAKAEQPGMLKGSARSIEGVHLRDVIDAVAARNPGLICRFGGHAMAAGLTLESDKLGDFEAALQAEIEPWRDALSQPDLMLTDGALAPAEMNLELAETLAAGGPWGQQFPEPLFANDLHVVETQELQSRHLKLRVRCPDVDATHDAIAFGVTELPATGPRDTLRFVYRLTVNDFRARRTPQLVVQHMQSE